jgi:hypothetical protein
MEGVATVAEDGHMLGMMYGNTSHNHQIFIKSRSVFLFMMIQLQNEDRDIYTAIQDLAP